MSCTKDKWCVIKEITVYPQITDPTQKSKAFLDWSKGIKFEEDKIVLPNGVIADGNIWMNNQLQFDNGSYTKFLLNEFNNG